MAQNQARNCSSGCILNFWAASCNNAISSSILFTWGQKEGDHADTACVRVKSEAGAQSWVFAHRNTPFPPNSIRALPVLRDGNPELFLQKVILDATPVSPFINWMVLQLLLSNSPDKWKMQGMEPQGVLARVSVILTPLP